jgi:hypothetical protein
MSRMAKFLVVSLVIGIFLCSYGLDLFAAREPWPADEATRMKIQFQEGGGLDASFSLPLGLVAVILASTPDGACIDMDGSSMSKRELWRRLRDSSPRNPVEFHDGGDRVRIWLE